MFYRIFVLLWFRQIWVNLGYIMAPDKCYQTSYFLMDVKSNFKLKTEKSLFDYGFFSIYILSQSLLSFLYVGGKTAICCSKHQLCAKSQAINDYFK